MQFVMACAPKTMLSSEHLDHEIKFFQPKAWYKTKEMLKYVFVISNTLNWFHLFAQDM